MSGYEAFAEGLAPLAKELKDCAGGITRLQKAMQKNTETGNLSEMKKNLEQLRDMSARLSACLESLAVETDGFDLTGYFVSGDFTRELLAACGEKGVDVKGDTGVYEMFPYKVRIAEDEAHAGEVYINRKKMPSCRPSFIAESIRAGQEKLFKANFNAESFMTELADAYETACLRSGARIGSTQSLDKIYKYMAPMARARKEYDKQAFAFDLAKLYEKGTDAWMTKGGASYYFGTSRDGKSGIRVLSSSGVESYISTLKPVQEDEA